MRKDKAKLENLIYIFLSPWPVNFLPQHSTSFKIAKVKKNKKYRFFPPSAVDQEILLPAVIPY